MCARNGTSTRGDQGSWVYYGGRVPSCQGGGVGGVVAEVGGGRVRGLVSPGVGEARVACRPHTHAHGRPAGMVRQSAVKVVLLLS